MKKTFFLILLVLSMGCSVKINNTNLYRKLVLYSLLNSRSAYHVIVLDSIYPLDSAIIVDSCGINDVNVVVTDDKGNSYPFDSLIGHGHYMNKTPFYPVQERKYSLNLKYKDFYEINVTTQCPLGVIFNKQIYYIDSTSFDSIYWNYSADCLYNVIVWDSIYGYTDFYEYSQDTSFAPEQLLEYYSSDTSYLMVKFYVYKYDKNYSDWYMETYYNNEFDPIENPKPYIGYFSSCSVESVNVLIKQ